MRGENARRNVALTAIACLALTAVLGLGPGAVAQNADIPQAGKAVLGESLADLLELALADNKDIKAAEYQLEAAKAGLKQVEAALNSQWQATASYSAANYSESLFEYVDGTLRTASGALTWARQLGPNATLQVGIDKASIAVEQAALQKQQAVIGVVTAVQSAYHNVIQAQRSVKVAEEALINAKRKVEDTRQKVAAGTATSVDLLAAENELRQAENGVFAAKSGLDVALLALTQIVGVESSLAEARIWAEKVVSQADVTPVKWDVDFAAAVEYAKAHRLDLSIAEKQLEMAKLDVDAAANQRDWKISLNGMTVKDDIVLRSTVDTDRLMTATIAKSKSEGSEPAEWVKYVISTSTGVSGSNSQKDPWQVTAELSYRFGDGGAKDARIEQAQAVYKSVQLQYEKLLEAISLDVYSAREKMLQAWRAYELSLEALEHAKAVYEQLRNAYAVGSISESEFLAGALLVSKAENDVVAAGLNYENSKTSTAVALGIPVDTLVSAISGKQWPAVVN